MPTPPDASLTAAQLRALVAPPVVRVQFDWDRFLTSGTFGLRVVPVGRTSGWYAPWYVDREVRPVAWDHPAAAPLTLGAVAADLGLHPSASGPVAQLEAVPLDRQVVVAVTYRVGSGDTLLLDGNHRIVAALRSRQQPRILQVALAGPVDPAICPDLGGRVGTSDR